MPVRRLALVGTLLYTGLVAWLTLGPIASRAASDEAAGGVFSLDQWSEAATWSRGSETEFVANVVLFVPLGALLILALGRGRWWLAGLLSIGATLAIEVVQWPLDSRISDPRDLLANTVGAFVGIALAARFAPRLRSAAR